MIGRIIIWILIILLITFFIVFNIEPKVRVYLFPGITLEDIPLALVIIISFILGLLSGMIIFLGQIVKYQLELRKTKKSENLRSQGGKDEG